MFYIFFYYFFIVTFFQIFFLLSSMCVSFYVFFVVLWWKQTKTKSLVSLPFFGVYTSFSLFVDPFSIFFFWKFLYYISLQRWKQKLNSENKNQKKLNRNRASRFFLTVACILSSSLQFFSLYNCFKNKKYLFLTTSFKKKHQEDHIFQKPTWFSYFYHHVNKKKNKSKYLFHHFNFQ